MFFIFIVENSKEKKMSPQINFHESTQYFNDVSNIFTVIDVASEKSKILDNYFFVEEVHALSSCKENECQVEAYTDALKGVLFNSEQSCGEQIKSHIL